MIKLNISNLADPYKKIINEIKDVLGIELSDSGLNLNVEIKNNKGITITRDKEYINISLANKNLFARAVSLSISEIEKNLIYEKPMHDRLEVMIDCSRNAVLHIEGFKKIVRYLALMGYTGIQIYTEDTYKIQGYDYFGYLRGAYTKAEFAEMQNYTDIFNIELIPCIQTLAHLSQVVKWQCFSDIVDITDILLVDEPKTYELIEAMIKTMSENLKSRRINIGMDEAHLLGLGKHLDKHGFEDRIDIMLRHFNKVIEIVRKYGYKPMMWSDMFFRLNGNNDYYTNNFEISNEKRDLIPDDISLIYWDYYSGEQGKYDSMIKKHKKITDNLIFAGGAWKWTGFSPNNEFSFYVGEAAYKSCKENSIKDIIITSWGDNGAEASIFTILPTLQFWAECCYADNTSFNHIDKRFRVNTQSTLSDFLTMDMINLTPNNPSPGGCSVGPSKYILYQDILCGLFDAHVDVLYQEHYENVSKKLLECIDRNPQWDNLFEVQYTLSRVLELKTMCGNNIRKAYNSNDNQVLQNYADVILPDLKIRIDDFMKQYTKQWNIENKIFGLDVFDIRMGGLLQRIERAISRINKYLKGEITELKELQEEILFFDCREKQSSMSKDIASIPSIFWSRIATPSVINHM